MKYEWIDEFLMGKPGVTRDLQAEWNWIRYQIEGKMFAAICRDDDNKPVYITLKLEPAEGEFWRSQYEDVIPGYYMNKVHWNSVKAEGEVPDDVVKGMLGNAYHIVFHSIPKKKQKEILENAAKDDLVSCCGSDCSTCYCYGKMCQGCNGVCGKVFHAGGKECAIYNCCRTKNGYYSCAECDKLPCELILGTRDPKMSEEEFMKSVEERVNRLKGNK